MNPNDTIQALRDGVIRHVEFLRAAAQRNPGSDTIAYELRQSEALRVGLDVFFRDQSVDCDAGEACLAATVYVRRVGGRCFALGGDPRGHQKAIEDAHALLDAYEVPRASTVDGSRFSVSHRIGAMYDKMNAELENSARYAAERDAELERVREESAKPMVLAERDAAPCPAHMVDVQVGVNGQVCTLRVHGYWLDDKGNPVCGAPGPAGDQAERRESESSGRVGQTLPKEK